MEEIKFRAWDYDNECMYDDTQIIIHNGTVFIGKIKFVHQISQDVELMQYINRKDEDGKNIFCGDILKIRRHNYPDKICEVYIEYGIPAYRGIGYVTQCHATTIHVIGNKYENADLFDLIKEA